MEVQYFKFEGEFIEENLRCIPMIIRFKLDRCGIKLALTEWSKMAPADRVMLADQPCSSKEEVYAYRNFVQYLVFFYTQHEASDLSIHGNPPWEIEHEVPAILVERLSEINLSLTINQWLRLEVLQRFALTKLCGSNHESKNFIKALREFKLAN